MKTFIEKRRVILIKTLWEIGEFAPNECYFYERPRGMSDNKGKSLAGHARWAGVNDIRDATNLEGMSSNEVLDLFYQIKDLLDNGDTIEIIDLVLTMSHTPVSFDPDLEKEFLREKALKKLTLDEIAALGVTNLAVYSKVKNHNT